MQHNERHVERTRYGGDHEMLVIYSQKVTYNVRLQSSSLEFVANVYSFNRNTKCIVVLKRWWAAKSSVSFQSRDKFELGSLNLVE